MTRIITTLILLLLAGGVSAQKRIDQLTPLDNDAHSRNWVEVANPAVATCGPTSDAPCTRKADTVQAIVQTTSLSARALSPAVDAGTNAAYLRDTSNALTGSTVLDRILNAGVTKWEVDNVGSLTVGTVPNARTTAASANTASAIVARDGSGNFSAGTVSAALSGNATTATALAANGANCSAGQAPRGVDAAGAIEDCTAYLQSGGAVVGTSGDFSSYVVASELQTSNGAVQATISNAGTTTVVPLMYMTRTTTGTAGAGLGTGITWILEDAAGQNETASQIETIWTDAADGSTDADILFKCMIAGAAATECARVRGGSNPGIQIPTSGEIKLGGDTGIERLSGGVVAATSGNGSNGATFAGGIGGSGSTGPVSVTAGANTTQIGNVGTGEDNLILYTLPATGFSANGKGVRITVVGTTANNANAKTLKVYFGTAVILTNSLTASVAGTWRVQAECFRTASNAQDCGATLFENGGAAVVPDIEFSSPTQTDNSSIAIKTTGEATSNDDIVAQYQIVEFMN